MAATFQQTDTAANASAIAAHCSGNSDNTDTESNTADVGGSAGTTARTIDMDVSGTDLNAVWMELDGIDDYDGASGNWTININITTSNHQIVLDEIHICRVNSSYVNQETLGSATGLNDSLGATGQISNVVNQSASTTITAGDKIIVIFAFDENQGMANAFAYTPDDTIEAPGTVAADIAIPVPVGSGVLTGFVPTATIDTSVAVPVGSLTLEGFPPPTVLQPSDFGLRLTGFAPSLEFSFTIPVPVGALVLDGKIPTVDIGADHIALPGTGTLTLAGQAPTATTTQNQVISVPVGTLVLTGQIPAVVVSQTVSPALGTLVLTGEIPTLVQTNNHIRAPPLGSLVLTGQVPVVLSGDEVIAQPATGALVLSGQVPTIKTTVSPGVGSLSVSGSIPTVRVGVDVSVPVGSLSLEGFPPPTVLQPSDFGLRLTGFIPTLSIADNQVITPGTGSLTITGDSPALEIVITNAPGTMLLEGFAPTVSVTPNKFLKIPVGTLVLNGHEPLLVIPQGSRGAQPGLGQLNLTGFDPTVYLSKYFPAKGTLNLQGRAPTVINTSDQLVVVVRRKVGRIKRKIRYIIEVDGQRIEVSSIAEAQSILLQVRELAEEAAQRDVKTAAVKPPQITTKTVSGNKTTSKVLQKAVRRTQKVITEAYIKRSREISQDIEISKLMITKIEIEERDDEESIIALLLM